MVRAVELDSVVKRFGATLTLDGLTLSVERGTLFGFLGPNGAGKTTTIRTLLGVIEPDSGSVSVLGLDPKISGDGVRRATGVLLENPPPQRGRGAEDTLVRRW